MIGISYQDLLSNPRRLEDICSKIIDESIASGAIYKKDGRKMTISEIKEIKADFKNSVKSGLQDLQTIEQTKEIIIQAYSHLIASNNSKAKAEQLKKESEQLKKESEQHRINAEKLNISSEKKLAQAEKLKAQAEQSRAQAEQSRAQAEQSRAQAEQSRAQAEQSRAQAEKERQDALTKQFWSIFNPNNSLAQERYSEVFNTYLSDRSLAIEKTAEGTCFARINSMNSVIKYLKANPLTKACDFRHFKAEVNDVETLVNFLKTSDAYAVKGVAFKTAISEIAKQKLTEAVTARSSTSSPLKVQYFA